MSRLHRVSLAATALVVTACGGGGDSTPPQPPPAPAPDARLLRPVTGAADLEVSLKALEFVAGHDALCTMGIFSSSSLNAS